MITKPMLAGKAPADLSQLKYPLAASVKLDGVRALLLGGKLVSRTWKPIPNKHIRETVESAGLPDGLDGELMVRGRAFNDASGDIRRADGKPDFVFHVFDYVKEGDTTAHYVDRIALLAKLKLPAFCEKVIPVKILTPEELTEFEAQCIAEDFEGCMTRRLDGQYKCGRSSTNEQILLKVKRFEDAEGVVVGIEEEMGNQNVAEKDAFGRTKRSSHQENLYPKGTLGKLIARWLKEDGKPDMEREEFGVGTGFTAAERADLFAQGFALHGRVFTFKFQKAGMKPGGRPRIPVFKAWRNDGM